MVMPLSGNPWWAMTVLLSLLLLSPGQARALALTDYQREVALGKHLLVLEDTSGHATLADVRKRTDWKPSSVEVPNFGFSDSAWWVRVSVSDFSTSRDRWILNINDAVLNQIDVYFVLPSGDILEKTGGGWVSPRDREIFHSSHAFHLPDASSLEIYVRVQSQLAVVLPVSIIRADRFLEKSMESTAIHMLYIGTLISVLAFNVVACIFLRESLYLHYCMFCLGLIVLSLTFSGLGAQYVWPEWHRYDNYTLAMTAPVFVLFATTFSEKFLFEGSQYRPPWLVGRRSVVMGLVLVSFVSILRSDFEAAVIFAVVGGVLALLNIFINCILMLNSRDERKSHAKYLLLAWTGMLIGGLLFVIRSLGLIPSNFFSTYGMQLGSVFECLMLTTALIVKSRNLQTQLNEQNARQRELLEAQVQARTAELSDTQQKLVASEKMAALGVFTAGMAHEINNPANFISVGAQNITAQLAGLKGFIHDLLADDPDPEIVNAFEAWFKQLETSNATVSEGISRIERIIKQLRADHPEGNVGLQPADPVRTLESAWQVFSPTVNVPLTLATDFQDRPVLPCIVAEILQVFLALLSNAAHAIEDAVAERGEGYQGQIRLASHQEVDALVITVADNGVGISADRIDKVFDPFFTTKAVGRGAGLGLSMARDVVKKHQGTLQVTSVVGEGTAFVLRLPLASH